MNYLQFCMDTSPSFHSQHRLSSGIHHLDCTSKKQCRHSCLLSIRKGRFPYKIQCTSIRTPSHRILLHNCMSNPSLHWPHTCHGHCKIYLRMDSGHKVALHRNHHRCTPSEKREEWNLKRLHYKYPFRRSECRHTKILHRMDHKSRHYKYRYLEHHMHNMH